MTKQMPDSPSVLQNGKVENNLEERCFAVARRAIAEFIAAIKESKVLRI